MSVQRRTALLGKAARNFSVEAISSLQLALIVGLTGLGLATALGGSAAYAKNGDIPASVIGTGGDQSPTYTFLVDADFTTNGDLAITSGNVRDVDQPLFQNQDKGVAMAIDAVGVVVTDSLEEGMASERNTKLTTTAFSQMTCGETDGRRFCLLGMSTMGPYKVKGKKLDVEPGGYGQLLVEEGCDSSVMGDCTAIVGPNSPFAVNLDAGAIVMANGYLANAYPDLEPIEWSISFETADMGQAGALQVTAGSGFSANQVYPGFEPLVRNAVVAGPSGGTFANTPAVFCWNGMWIYCDTDVPTKDTCRLL